MNNCVDILSLSHFIFFLIFGLYVKNRYILAFLLGIVWEIFEYLVVNNDYIKPLLIKYWFIPQKYWEEKYVINRVTDLIFNILGYYGGNLRNIKKKERI